MSLDGFVRLCWKEWIQYILCVYVRVCVCVRDEAQRGVKTSDGVSLVVLPELFSTWGNMWVSANPGYLGRPQSGRLLLCFSYSVQTHISKQQCLFWVTVYEKKGMYRCVLRSSKGLCPVRLTESSFGLCLHSLILLSVSANLTEGTNKQIGKKKKKSGAGVHECVIFSGKASYSAVGLHSCQVICGSLCVFLFSPKCPRKGAKDKDNPLMWRPLHWNEFL